MIPLRIRAGIDRRAFRYAPSLYEKFRYLYYKTFEPHGGYDRAYYTGQLGTNAHSYKLLAQGIMAEFHPKTLVDVGCGSGGISAAFMRCGCEQVFGFDGSAAAVQLAREHGLTQVQQLDFIQAATIPAKGDVCLCCEVAEHIPEKHAAHLCHLLAQPAPVLVFTAASEGQPGHLHVNLKPRAWWIDLMQQQGLRYDSAAVQRVRAGFSGQGMIRDYDVNLMIFSRT